LTMDGCSILTNLPLPTVWIVAYCWSSDMSTLLLPGQNAAVGRDISDTSQLRCPGYRIFICVTCYSMNRVGPLPVAQRWNQAALHLPTLTYLPDHSKGAARLYIGTLQWNRFRIAAPLMTSATRSSSTT
jgi:hypothetical protein